MHDLSWSKKSNTSKTFINTVPPTHANIFHIIIKVKHSTFSHSFIALSFYSMDVKENHFHKSAITLVYSRVQYVYILQKQSKLERKLFRFAHFNLQKTVLKTMDQRQSNLCVCAGVRVCGCVSVMLTVCLILRNNLREFLSRFTIE